MPPRKIPFISAIVLSVWLILLALSINNNSDTAFAAELESPLESSTLSAAEITSGQQGEPRLTATFTRTPTPINVGNFVWDDRDHDGRQDAGEPGIAGVQVQLWNSSKTALIDTAITNSNGNYSLIAPTPGNYRVRVLLPNPAMDSFSPKDQASGDDLLDSDINPSGTNFGFTDIYVFASNLISITSIDAGIIIYRTPTPTRTPTPINIGNFVWNDTNGDGYQNDGEPGLVGITVQLWNSSKTSLIDMTTTNANGNYTVVAPLPGDYRVRVLLPIGASFALKDQGNDQYDSDINQSGTDYGFTDVFTLNSYVISTVIYDAGLISVPNTPTFTHTPPDGLDGTASPTPSLTPSATTPVSGNDTLALFSKKLTLFSLVDTLQSAPPASSYNTYVSSAPEKGKFVMGDWDGDGQQTPGLFKGDDFWYTNQIGATATWSSVTIGDYGKITVVAGRFDPAVGNDCVGVVQMENVPQHNFALRYTCELTAAVPPSGIQTQWIDIQINGVEKYQFVAGDWNADGLDSIAVRRDKKIKWGNVAPAQGAAVFGGTQKFTKDGDSYGDLVSGDWNNDGIDTFGLYSKGDGLFYYRSDLNKDKLTPTTQNVGLPIGKALAMSWRKTILAASPNDVLGLPEIPAAALSPLSAATPTPPPASAG